MSAASVLPPPATRVGWCPGALRPMRAGDGLLVRIKPRGGRMAVGTLAAVATLSTKHGNGALTLTSRANLQLRGLDEPGMPQLTEALDALGLLDARPEGEAVRNVVTSPFCGTGDAVAQAAAALEDRLATDPALWRLPPKIAWAVDGPDAPLGPVGADVHATVEPDGRCFVRLAEDGPAAAVPPGGLPEAGARLAAAFLSVCGAQGVLPHRFVDLAAWGGLHALLERAGLPPVNCAPAPRGAAHPVGPYRYGEAAGLGVAFPFGLMTAATLRQVAETAAGAGVDEVRLTPWRGLLVPGFATPVLMGGTGAVVDATDPRLRVAACIGAPGCGRATTAVPADAAALAATLSPPRGEGIWLHVSGCGKGCAHAGAAPATLVGRAGVYDVVLGGRADDEPVRLGSHPAVIAATLPSLLEAFRVRRPAPGPDRTPGPAA